MFKTKNKSFGSPGSTDSTIDSTAEQEMPFGKSSLDHTLEDFLGKEQEKKPSYINAATISGTFIVLTTFSFILFRMGLDFGPGSIDALPFLGGIFLLLAAVSSRFVGEKKPKKEKKKKTKEDVFGGQHYPDEPLRYEGFGSDSKQASQYSKYHSGTNKQVGTKNFDVFGSGDSKPSSTGNTQYDNNQPYAERGRTNTFQADSTTYSWGYFQQRRSKRLYKSRNDKKLWGVCGGLADFFGIGTMWVRSIFVLAFFMGWGSSLFIYVALSLILNKEPLDLDYPEKW